MTFHPAFPRPEDRLFGGSDTFIFSFDSGPGPDGLTGVFGNWPSSLSGEDGSTAPVPPLDSAQGLETSADDAPAPDTPDGPLSVSAPDSMGPLDASSFFEFLADLGSDASRDATGGIFSGWMPLPFGTDGGTGWAPPAPAAHGFGNAADAGLSLDGPQAAVSASSPDRAVMLSPSGFLDLPSAKGGNGGGNGGGKPPSDGGGGGGGGDPVLSEYDAGSSNGTDGYDILIDFLGNDWTVALQQAFIDAADYLVTVITGDIGGGGRYRGNTIDDLYITAKLAQIDGSGGVLGQAGPTAAWTSNDLTAAGQMEFDVADASDFFNLGLWDDIVMHEMMHVLGFGTLWDYGSHAGLVQNGYQYVGANALAAYDETHPGATYIPVETDGGSGTAGGHWDEAALTNELMTGYINDDGDPYTTGDNVLSEFSVMALADLGYDVTYEAWTDTAYTDPLIA
jgi:hypothetical protein